MKPRPSSPMRFDAGTRTSSKKICAVSDECRPSFDSLCRVLIGRQRHDDKRFIAVGTILLAGIHQHTHPIGLNAVRYPHLLTVYDVVVAIPARNSLRWRRPNRADFGDADTSDQITRKCGRQPFLTERVAAILRQRRIHMLVWTPMAVETP